MQTDCYAVCNSARSSIYSGYLTYEKLFKAIPFDNEIYILDVTASSLYNELVTYGSSNFFTRYDTTAFDDNKTYRIAVIDYLALHKGSNRNYNYFPNATIVGKLTKVGYDIYNYRDITREYILSNYSSSLDATMFSKSLSKHNADMLYQNI